MTISELYKVDIPEGVCGNWKVEKITVTKEDEKNGRMSAMFAGHYRFVREGTYTRLKRGNVTVMSDTPDEIRDHYEAIHKAHGLCLVNGLGLGMVAAAMLNKPEVSEVWVVELSPEVIQLVGTVLKGRYGPRLRIIQANALEYKPPKGIRFDVVWHDIWDTISADNMGDMKLLHRRYGRICNWQESWCRDIVRCHYREDQQYMKRCLKWQAAIGGAVQQLNKEKFEPAGFKI